MIQELAFGKAGAQDFDQARRAQKMLPITNRGLFLRIKRLGCQRSQNRFLNRVWYKLLAFLLFFSTSVFSALTVPADAPVVIIDVGHGGTDLGARAQPPYCEEKRICLQTARLVKKHLNQLGYRVVMTRDTDVFVSLSKRVEIAGQASGDLFVSIHCNSTRNPTAHGIEIFFYENKEDKTRSGASRKLADAILGKVIHRTSALSRGVKKGNFYVIRESTMPAVLVESGFLSNPGERSLLRTREYQEKIARGIVDGVDSFFKKLSK